MEESFSTYQTSRLIYSTSDFYSADDPELLYGHLDQVLFELMGHSNFTLFFPNKIENLLQIGYSNHVPSEQWKDFALVLDSPVLKSVLDPFNQTGILVTEDPQALAQWPFPARYCALLNEEKTILGVLVIHEGLNESVCGSYPVIQVLEPVIKHFTLALMRLRSEQEVERMLDETNARLLAINEIGELLGHLDLDTLLSKIVSLALQLIRAEVANLMFLEGGQLRSQVEWGLSEEVINGILWRDHTRMVDMVLKHHMPLLVENLRTDRRFVVHDPSRQVHSIVSIPLFTSSKDLGVLNVVNTHGGESFSKDNLATLQTVAGLASTAIENALLHKEAIEREVFREQLRIARQIWENILPKKIPQFPGVSIAARSDPASVVGGDFYDFIPLNEDRLGLVIADVSGKGIPAAMVMNMAKSVLHIEAMRGNDPASVLQTVNNLLVDSTRVDSFVTLTYAIVDRSTRKIRMTNAGHNPCLIFHWKDRKCEFHPSENMPLAILPDLTFTQIEVDYQPGDCFVLYTDGVTEAMNREREMYELDRLQELIGMTEENDSAERILERIFQSVKEFCGDVPQHDDTTVVVFRVSR